MLLHSQVPQVLRIQPATEITFLADYLLNIDWQISLLLDRLDNLLCLQNLRVIVKIADFLKFPDFLTCIHDVHYGLPNRLLELRCVGLWLGG